MPDDEDLVLILESAARHGVDESDARHALEHAIDAYDVGDDMTMYIGPARDAVLLEIGVVDWREATAIVHAMLARPRFLRRL